MDNRALIQLYLNGSLNDSQIADFTAKLRDPVFCRILQEERDRRSKQKVIDAAREECERLAQTQAATGQGVQKEHFDLLSQYILGNMDGKTMQTMAENIKKDAALRREYIFLLNVVKGVISEQRQNDMEFGLAMKRLSSSELESIVGPRRENESAADRLQTPARARRASVPPSSRDVALRCLKAHRLPGMFYSLAPYADMSSCEDGLHADEAIAAVAKYVYTAEKPDFASYGQDPASKDKDYDKLTEGELQAYADKIEAVFAAANEKEAAAEALAAGKDLAVVYLRLCKYGEAMQVLERIVSKYKGEDLDGAAAEMMKRVRTIFELLSEF